MEDESRLVRLAQGGDMNAFRELVERHKKSIFYLAYDLTGNIHDAEDLSQETFIKLYRSLSSFRGEAALGTFLYRVTVNRWIEIKRTLKHKMMKQYESIDEKHSILDELAAETSNSETEASQIRAQVESLLGELSPGERSAFTLRHYHDHSIAEIGRIMNVSTGTVKSTLFRAVKKLRERLSANAQAPSKEAHQ